MEVGKVRRTVVDSSAPVGGYLIIAEVTVGALRVWGGRVWYRVWKTQVREYIPTIYC